MNKKIPLAVIIFIVLVYVIVMSVSCTTPAKIARKEAKKNEQAYQRVLTDSGMFRSIGLKFASLQKGCTNDTIIGETQVLILSDTTVIPGKTDTVIRPDTVRITTTKVKKETQYITDVKAVNELQDSLHDSRVREAKKDGQIIQLTKDKADQEKRATLAEKTGRKLTWGIWGLIILLLVTHGLRSIPSLKKLL